MTSAPAPGDVSPADPGPADTAALAARSAQLYYVYARAVDDGDLDTLRSIVTDDVRITRGGHPTERGVEAFLDVYRAHNALQIPVCQHVVTNVLVTNVTADPEGTRIGTHAYFQATFLEVDRTRVIIGCYDDEHLERGGELTLDHKRITVQRVLTLPASTGSFVHAGRG